MASNPIDLRSRTISSLESRLEQIAVLPSVISRLAALDLDSPVAADIIVELARNDPTLALRMMRVANVNYPGKGGIDSIPTAVLLTGTAVFAKLVLAMTVVEVFVPRTQGQRNLWIHSIQTALTARRLAVLQPESGLGYESCYLAGLLHDIGRFFIFEHLPEDMAQLDEAHVANLRELIDAEVRICGFDHAELGSEICRRWKLPESVCEMVRVHHMYGNARSEIPPEVAALVELVQEADLFSFGLLRNPASSFHSDLDRARAVEASLNMLSTSERILPAERLAAEMVHIDNDARAAAAFINIAYGN
jgi:putative nucleotidyltransferase with HDIG domain